MPKIHVSSTYSPTCILRTHKSSAQAESLIYFKVQQDRTAIPQKNMDYSLNIISSHPIHGENDLQLSQISSFTCFLK